MPRTKISAEIDPATVPRARRRYDALDVMTYGIEAAVGVTCLAAAYDIRRRPGLRLIAALLAVAGMTAVVHAAVALF